MEHNIDSSIVKRLARGRERIVLVFVITFFIIGCTTSPSPVETDEGEPTASPTTVAVDSGTQPLSVNNVWPTTIIPVCWENPSVSSQNGQQRTQVAVEGSWESVSAIDFVGWEQCTNDSRGIRIKIADEGPHVKVLGSSLAGKSEGMLLNFTFSEWTCSRADCIEVIAVHEFGHALGFAHEQNRRDAWYNCQDEHQGSGPALDITFFDIDSVMNYCNPDWSGDGNLSASDIAGVQQVYGLPDPEVVAFSDINNATELDIICSISINEEPTPIVDFTQDDRCPNDEARSLIFLNVSAGRAFRLFDDPGGSRSDDWVVIVFKRDVTSKVIGSLEGSFEDEDVLVQYHWNDDLDGKISRFEINPPGPLEAVIDFHEGNSGTQNLVCSVLVASLTTLGPLDFTADNDCANDESRSLTMYNVAEGSVLRIFDSSTGNTADDWVEIRAKQAITTKTIPTFENSFEDNDVAVVYVANDNLDGKVSRVEYDTATIATEVITLYEGNNATQNVVCTILLSDLQTRSPYIFSQGDGNCSNDEARSMTLVAIPAGTVLRLFDASDGDLQDDWVEIVTKRDLAIKTIGTFEQSLDDPDVEVTFFSRDGLNGKVSRIELASNAFSGATIVFYEGNSGTQDIVCELVADQARTIDFTNTSSCDNDEVRSLKLVSMPAGARIRVYDNSSCSTSDDWTEIRTLTAVARYVVPTFEADSNDGVVAIDYKTSGNLDGKVSCIIIEP